MKSKLNVTLIGKRVLFILLIATLILIPNDSKPASAQATDEWIELEYCEFGYYEITQVSPTGYFYFYANAGGPLEIYMERLTGEYEHLSNDLDPYLRLTDANGNILAEDDDSGGNLDALIRIEEIPYTGIYGIIASSLNGTTGRYLIMHEMCNGGGGGDGACNDFQVTGELPNHTQPDWGSHYYVTGVAGQTIEFTLQRTAGTLSPYLELYEPSGKYYYHSKPGRSRTAILKVKLEYDGDYLLVAYGYNDTTGKYRLRCHTVIS